MIVYWLVIVSCFTNAPIQMEDHAIYISTMYFDLCEDHADVEVRVFEDDLRSVIRNHTGEIPDTSSALFSDQVLSYFRKYLSTTHKDHVVEWQLKDLELVGDSYRVYLTGDLSSAATSTIQIAAPYFSEVFPNQKNILKFTHGEDKEFFVFDHRDDIFDLEL